MCNKAKSNRSMNFNMRHLDAPVAVLGALAVVGLSPLLGLDVLVTNGYHDTQRWLELFLFAGIAVLAVYRVVVRKNKLLNSGDFGAIFVLAFFVFGLISVSLSKYPFHAFFEWGVLLFLCILGWVVADEISRDPDVRLNQALKGVVFGCLLYVFKALVTYFSALHSGVFSGPGYLIPGYDTFRFFNHAQTITMPLLALFLCLFAGERLKYFGWYVAGWLAFIAWWMLLFVSSGRGTLVGIIASVIFVGLSRRVLAWPWIRTMILGMLAGYTAYSLLYVVMPHSLGLESLGGFEGVVERSVNNFGSSRGILWSCAVEMISMHPWLGSGPLHYAHACAWTKIAAHPHNWIFQIAAEWGLVALLSLCSAIYMGFVYLIRSGEKIPSDNIREQAKLTCWLAAGTGIIVDGLVSGLLVMPVSQLWIAIYFGFAAGWMKSVYWKNSNGIADVFVMRLAAIIGILTGCFILTIGVITTQLEAQYAASQLMRLAPRAWGYGFF